MFPFLKNKIREGKDQTVIFFSFFSFRAKSCRGCSFLNNTELRDSFPTLLKYLHIDVWV